MEILKILESVYNPFDGLLKEIKYQKGSNIYHTTSLGSKNIYPLEYKLYLRDNVHGRGVHEAINSFCG